MRATLRTLTAAVALVAVAAACSGDDTDGATTATTAGDATSPTTGGASTTSSEATGGPLRVLVTNDDGVGAEGIDALVETLSSLPDVDVTVVAPAEQETGQGDATSDGPLTTVETATASGHPAVAVQGFPADTVVWALDGGLAEAPHLVVAGVNFGQNLGPGIDVSGTVGAARAAARRGVPALAVGQGLGDPPDYAAGVQEALAWIDEHREELLEGSLPADVWNLNVPTCPDSSVRELVEVPVASTADGIEASRSDCASTLVDPADDVEAFTNGFVTLSVIDVAG